MSAAITIFLSVQDMRKHFTLHLRGGQTLPVLHGVSLDALAGECVALVGGSGQGKSMLINCLYGSYGVDSGHILFERDQGDAPLDLASAKPQEVLDLRRRELAYVSQFLRALPRVGALDVVAERLLQSGDHPDEAGWRAAQAAARAQVAELFARLNLPEAIWDLPPATFSGGEQQRVNIARGFVQPARPSSASFTTRKCARPSPRAVSACLPLSQKEALNEK
jgi:alpha-D-ribose 1-methylphosphonate 5-triphosphate synthase subunit PhnL